MAFQTSLSGLNAAATNLSVTGNNIANSSTTGFKGSRTEFGDIFAVSFSGNSSSAVGSGVKVTNVAQQFSQGNIAFTENSLDLAISGDGFFVLRETDGTMKYTRAGAFTLDRDGFVTNSTGQNLQYYPIDVSGNVTDTSVRGDGSRDLQIDTSPNPASATTTIDLNMNVDAASLGIPSVLDVNNPASYNFSTSSTIYDSLGVTHNSTLYFKRASATSSVTPSGVLDLADPSLPDIIMPMQLSDSTGQLYDAQLRFTEVPPVLPAVTPTWDVVLEPDPAGANPMNAAATTTLATGLATPAGVTYTIPGFDPSGGAALPSSLVVDLRQIVTTTNGVASSLSVPSANYAYNGPSNTWYATMAIDGTVYDTEVVEFNPDGSLRNGPSYDFVDNSGGFSPTSANPVPNLTVDLTGSTQFGGNTTVNTMIQDGYAQGTVTGIDIDDKGIVFARYSNGQTTMMSAVAMAKFANKQGLQPTGNTNWAATYEAGIAVGGQAGTGTFGRIQSSALESSNVDISQQLVNMIIAQRDFQANAKMISTEDQLTQTIINIR
jgi:flagellar hook protein FlgE